MPTNDKILAFPYYGGKYTHLDWILPKLPQKERYIEPFGGSAAVLLNREPANIETYNDIDGEIVNFFQVLREDTEELIRQLRLTPFSRKEFDICRSESSTDISDVERARRFFVRITQGFNARPNGMRTSWRYSVGTTARGRSMHVSANEKYRKGLQEVAERLRRVQLECGDAIEIIETHDDPAALIYLDPPYPPEVRDEAKDYVQEYSENDFRELADVLQQCESDVAISSYKCDLFEELFSGWNCHDSPESGLRANGTDGGTRVESIWTNYQVPNSGDVNQSTLESHISG